MLCIKISRIQLGNLLQLNSFLLANEEIIGLSIFTGHQNSFSKKEGGHNFRNQGLHGVCQGPHRWLRQACLLWPSVGTWEHIPREFAPLTPVLALSHFTPLTPVLALSHFTSLTPVPTSLFSYYSTNSSTSPFSLCSTNSSTSPVSLYSTNSSTSPVSLYSTNSRTSPFSLYFSNSSTY